MINLDYDFGIPKHVDVDEIPQWVKKFLFSEHTVEVYEEMQPHEDLYYIKGLVYYNAAGASVDLSGISFERYRQYCIALILSCPRVGLSVDIAKTSYNFWGPPRMYDDPVFCYILLARVESSEDIYDSFIDRLVDSILRDETCTSRLFDESEPVSRVFSSMSNSMHFNKLSDERRKIALRHKLILD